MKLIKWKTHFIDFTILKRSMIVMSQSNMMIIIKINAICLNLKLMILYVLLIKLDVRMGARRGNDSADAQ